MSAIHETAYPQLKIDQSRAELKENFTPTAKERIIMNQHAKGNINQFGFILTLKCYQCLGYSINLNKVPPIIKAYVAKKLGISELTDLSAYNSSKSRKRHFKVIREFINISNDRTLTRQCMKKAALHSAATKENLSDIINDMLEELVKARLELPAFISFLRLARAARVVCTNHYYQQITALLNDNSKKFIDNLYDSAFTPEGHTTGWAFLKQEVQKPSVSNLKNFLDYYHKIKEWKEQVPVYLDDIPVHRLEQFHAEGMAVDASNINDIRPDRRYALATVVLHYQVSNAIDDLATILIKWVSKIHHDAREALQKHILNQQKEVTHLVDVLHQLLLAASTDKTGIERLKEIESCLPKDKSTLIEQCENHLAYRDDNYLPFMLKLYKSRRHILFKLLYELEIHSSTHDKTLEELITFIKKHYASSRQWIELEGRERGTNHIRAKKLSKAVSIAV